MLIVKTSKKVNQEVKNLHQLLNEMVRLTEEYNILSAIEIALYKEEIRYSFSNNRFFTVFSMFKSLDVILKNSGKCKFSYEITFSKRIEEVNDLHFYYNHLSNIDRFTKMYINGEKK